MGFLEQHQTQNLQNVALTPFDLKFLPNDRHQHVDADCYPDLCLYCVLCGPIKRLDAKVLFDPFEEQFDLPTTTIKLRDGDRGQRCIVGQEYQSTIPFNILKDDASKSIWITLCRLHALQCDDHVASQSGRLIDRLAGATTVVEVAFGPNHEEGSSSRDAVQASEVEVASIHDIEGLRLNGHGVENVHIVHFPLGNVDKTRDAASKVEQRMHFDRRFTTTELGPRKEAETEVDGCRIECVNGLLQPHAERFAVVQRACAADEDMGEIGEDSPVVNAVGIGECAARNATAEACVIEFGTKGAKAGFDVAETFAEGELGEGKCQKLIATGEVSESLIAVIANDAVVEFASREEVEKLGENRASGKHRRYSNPGRVVGEAKISPRKLKSCTKKNERNANDFKQLRRMADSLAGQ